MNSQKKSTFFKQNLGEDVVNMYKNYKNTQTKWKQSMVGGVMFQLPDYYKTIGLIGNGAYGAVATAIDNRLPEELRQDNMVAIKKMTNAFEHKIYARRVLRELKLLRLLKHVNIINIKTIILPKSRQCFEDIYAVFQLMDSDIYSVVRKGQQELTQAHYQYFIYQILRGLMYIHSANVIHRDIKTRNLLINADCNIKICDFGLSRPVIKQKVEGMMTDYVATRWYRAPELLLGQTSYTPAVDIWSVGCIMAQLILKRPFLPASSTKQQLQLICQLVQTSDLDDLKEKNQKNFKIIQNILEKKKKKKKTNLIQEKFSTCSPQARQLLKRMLAFQPSKRITAKQAINLPYFNDFRQEQFQTTRQPIDSLEFEFDKHNLTTQQLKDIIYEQILLYHFKNFQQAYKEKLTKKSSVIDHILNNSNSKNINPYTDADDDEDDDDDQ